MEFFTERVFPSKKGLHIKFNSKKEAELYYKQGLKLGNQVQINENVVIMLNSKAAQNSQDKFKP